MSILGVEVCRSPGDLASSAEFIQQIPNGKSRADVGIRVKFAARIEGLRAIGDHFSSQWNVSRNHEIARCNQFNDASIGDVHARGDEQAVYELGTWRAHGLIGDQCYLGLGSIRGAKQQLLDFAGASVGALPSPPSIWTPT